MQVADFRRDIESPTCRRVAPASTKGTTEGTAAARHAKSHLSRSGKCHAFAAAPDRSPKVYPTEFYDEPHFATSRDVLVKALTKHSGFNG